MVVKNNYSLRLNKDIERKLIAQNILELKKYWYIFHDYLYVGFWSIYFMDFKLFHKLLGISDMISFEKWDTSRPNFNSPYDFIKIESWNFAERYRIIDFSKKIFFRLDYEDPLTNDILRDIDDIVRNKVFKKWTILSFSFQCHLPIDLEEINKYIDNFWEWWKWYLKWKMIDGERSLLPQKEDIKQGNLGDIYTQILEGKIKACLMEKTDMDCLTLYKYSYKDWAKMFTVWFLLDSKERVTQIKQGIWDIPIININAPILTLKEKEAFNKNLSGISDILRDEENNKEARISEKLGYKLNEKWIEEYLKFYKEYPHFTEVTI